ncbi:sulfotransferase 1C2-like [Mya arenaria]|uniref:sulfotransferase 1C2-like n=1 Tax=Mya arenaria TaxID=6604 RepID=UPI0022E31BEF|nr:sulfotransferase 1C2-like [Mya arenaria]
METFEDDIWVCGFPRSGTTLTTEIVELVQTLDFEKANTVQLDERFAFIERIDETIPNATGMDALKNAGSPRVFKSHLQYKFLPKMLQGGKGRMVYVCRNPKDVVLSWYKLMQWFDWCDMSLAEFFEDFMNGKVLYGGWEDHVLGFWKNTKVGNLLFLKYEDVVKDIPKTIRDIASFLGRTLTDGDVNRIHEHCSIESMRKNPTLNLEHMAGSNMKDGYGGFINKGKPGTWRESLTSEMSSRLDDVLKQVAEKGLSFECC